MYPTDYSMTDIAPTVSSLLKLPAPAAATGRPIPPIVNDLAHHSRVAIVAPDALGLFPWNHWKEEMPFLGSLHAHRSLILRSVMPSITPVNFAAMVAGVGMEVHGVKTFRHDFSCETLFDVVRRAGGRSAGIGLRGYTGCELLGRFADICGDAGKESDDEVVRTTLEIAGRESPDFLIAQLGQVDDAFHRHGPSSPLLRPMMQATDQRMQRIIEGLETLGYGIITLADHGQHDLTEPSSEGHLGIHGTDSDEDVLVPCSWV